MYHDPCPGIALGDLGTELDPVDGLPDINEADELPNLVALQLSDEVNGGPSIKTRQLRHSLLGVVFADLCDPGCHRGTHEVDVVSFRNPDDLDPFAADSQDPFTQRAQPSTDDGRIDNGHRFASRRTTLTCRPVSPRVR